jgi:hypothetical protein
VKETKEIAQSQFVVLLSYILKRPFEQELLYDEYKFWRFVSSIIPNNSHPDFTCDLVMGSNRNDIFTYTSQGLILGAFRQMKVKANTKLPTVFTLLILTEISQEHKKFVEIALADLPFKYYSDYEKDFTQTEIAICNIIYGNTRIERMEATLANLKKGMGYL